MVAGAAEGHFGVLASIVTVQCWADARAGAAWGAAGAGERTVRVRVDLHTQAACRQQRVTCLVVRVRLSGLGMNRCALTFVQMLSAAVVMQ